MNGRSSLFEAYESWREWTETETDAIQASNWAQVSQCQEAKRALQPLIIRLTEDAQSEAASEGWSWSGTEQELRRIISSLIGLESRNGELVAAQRQAALAQMNALKDTSRNLRRVRHSYAPSATPHWCSYS